MSSKFLLLYLFLDLPPLLETASMAAKNKECLISIDLANALNQFVYAMKLKISRRDIGFRCPECHELVNPHLKSERQPARFENLKRNPDCSLSTKLEARSTTA